VPKEAEYPVDEKKDRNLPRKKPLWVEVPIFIHGISPDKYPTNGTDQYKQLFDLVKEKLKNHPEKKFTGEPIFVTWGVPTEPPQSSGTDQYLAEVERKIQEKLKEKMGKAYSNPFGLTGYVRDLLFFGVSDLFYYVSEDGEKDMRKHIFGYISKEIKKIDAGGDNYISLTIFGHSAGSVIAHDMLFHMFSEKEHPSEEGRLEDEMEFLRKMIAEGRLRIRRLYTFGSPISLLVLRASSLVNKFRKGGTFIPHEIGLMMGDNLSAPRWVNFWSRYDLASYPVDFLYSNEKGLIEDREISTSLGPNSAHTGYWGSDEMADYISQTF
jgi:hypothetical protein